jgi:hypothetical protein
MALTFQRYPFELKRLSQWLAESQPLREERTSLVEGGELRLIGPFPSYYADARRFLADSLAGAKKTGWRALLESNEQQVGLVDITLSTAGEPHFGVRGREAAEAFGKALQVAADASSDGSYEVRWLSLSDIYVTAVWLHGKRDLFAPTRLGSSHRVDPNIIDLQQLLEIVRKLVAAQTDLTTEGLLRRRLWSTRSPRSGLPE